MVYITVYLQSNMKQKLQLLKMQKLVLEKEVNLGGLLRQHLESKNLDLSKFDEYAKISMFSIDGAIPNVDGKPLSSAQMMDVVVKPDHHGPSG